MFEHGDEERLCVVSFPVHPNRFATVEDLKSKDGRIAHDIEAAEEMIEKLKEYRKMLFDRAQELETHPKKKLVEIVRSTSTENRVYYLVAVYDIVQDGNPNGHAYNWRHRGIRGTIQQLQAEQFEGKDRRAAIRKFRDLCKMYPGAMVIDEKEVRKR